MMTKCHRNSHWRDLPFVRLVNAQGEPPHEKETKRLVQSASPVGNGQAFDGTFSRLPNQPHFLEKRNKTPCDVFLLQYNLVSKNTLQMPKNKKGSLDFLEQARVFNHGLLPRIHRPSARPGEEHGLASGPKRPLRPAPASRVPRFASPIRNQQAPSPWTPRWICF